MRPLELKVRLPLIGHQLAPQSVIGQETKSAAALKHSKMRRQLLLGRLLSVAPSAKSAHFIIAQLQLARPVQQSRSAA